MTKRSLRNRPQDVLCQQEDTHKSVNRCMEGEMKSTNRYKEDTMKSFNRYAAFSLRAILAAAVVMFGTIRPNDYLSRAEPTAFAAEQPAPGALQWRQTSGPEGASVIIYAQHRPKPLRGDNGQRRTSGRATRETTGPGSATACPRSLVFLY